MPADDKEGWARVHKKAPYFVPVKATCGSGGLSPQTPVSMASYAYPIFMTYADRPADTIYAVTKAMIDTYNGYKDGAPGAEGMALLAAELPVGRPLPRRRRPRLQGEGRVDRRGAEAQPTPWPSASRS